MSATNKFLTMNEAATLVGKSPSSIRRIIYPILRSEKHPDRALIEPSVKQAKELRLKGENFAWKISEELLRREVPEGESKPRSDAGQKSTGDLASPAIIDMLRRELEIKNQQIATQNDLLKGLSERLREGNILMGSLQQQLALTDGTARKSSDVVETQEKGTLGQQSDEIVDEPDTAKTVATKPVKKPGWLSILFP